MKLKHVNFYRALKRSGQPATEVDLEALSYDNAFVRVDAPTEKLLAVEGHRGRAVAFKEALIAFPCFMTKDGKLGGAPSNLRKWESHGIKLEAAVGGNEFERFARADAMRSTQVEEWVTFRHPRSPDGPRDYSTHVPVTFKAYLDAKDTTELDPVVEPLKKGT